MIVSGPIWYTRANETLCRKGHQPRSVGASQRGDCLRLFACQVYGCGECAIGIQCMVLDTTVWHSVSRPQFDAICATDPCTPVLTILHLAGYTNRSDEIDATKAA